MRAWGSVCTRLVAELARGAAVASLACAGGVQGGAGPEHPLVGRIWEIASERFASEEDLFRFLAARRYVLLGEVHDNAVHHRLQAQMLSRLAAADRRPAVVFEMIPRDRADALAAALADPAVTAEDVRRAVAWDESGWPDWSMYAPVFESALRADLVLAAGDLARAERETLRSRGIDGLERARIEALALDEPLPAPVHARLEASIREGHCDLLPEAALPAMVAFQRTRDAQLARALVEAAGPGGAVLVAGAGHVRRDMGVPYHLARLDPDASVASVALVEVREGHADPRLDLAELFAEGVPFDFVWFTPRAPREDPCEALERKLAPRAGQVREHRSRTRILRQRAPRQARA